MRAKYALLSMEERRKAHDKTVELIDTIGS